MQCDTAPGNPIADSFSSRTMWPSFGKREVGQGNIGRQVLYRMVPVQESDRSLLPVLTMELAVHLRSALESTNPSA